MLLSQEKLSTPSGGILSYAKSGSESKDLSTRHGTNPSDWRTTVTYSAFDPDSLGDFARDDTGSGTSAVNTDHSQSYSPGPQTLNRYGIGGHSRLGNLRYAAGPAALTSSLTPLA